MKCRRIHFQGYKRLADAQCDVSPHLLAFVGQNEAGKSTVLAGLEWLSEDGQTPLAEFDKSRAKKLDSGWVVGARFALDDEDVALLKPLGFKEVPAGFSIWKQVNGTLHVTFDDPDELIRDPAPIQAARSALDKVERRFKTAFDIEGAVNGDESPARWMSRIAPSLQDPEARWSDDAVAAAESLSGWLSEVPEGNKRPRSDSAARLLAAASEAGARPHPRDVGLEVLRSRLPKFLLFRQEDRDLPTQTQIDDSNRSAIRPAIRNLLSIGDADAAELWRLYAAGDTGEIETCIGRANKRLDGFFRQAWNQSNVAVRLKVDAGVLQAHVYEIESGRFTRLEERSDGLRAFIALAAFLEAQHLSVAPILLIDEAETHLHFDAQADLVGALLKQVKATQIYYSTHSPGCLPSDLGTGIRLLERDGIVSSIKSHFWTNEAPGFAPLLFAMGAGAAAFSACRWAVVAEGASDMIMLPSFIRRATKLSDLPYQVAPGLANVHKYGMQVEEVAARVVYLADGDGDGNRYREELLSAGVPETRALQLPPGMTTEDLLDVDFYLNAVFGMLPQGLVRPAKSQLDLHKPIAKALEAWCLNQSPTLRMPGKVAVAYKVIEQADIKLKPAAREILKALHAQFLQAFGPPDA